MLLPTILIEEHFLLSGVQPYGFDFGVGVGGGVQSSPLLAQNYIFTRSFALNLINFGISYLP